MKMPNKTIDFNKLLKNHITSNEFTLWKDGDSSLELIQITNIFPNTIFEAGFISIKKPKERLLDFYNVIEWLRKNPQVFNIVPNIYASLDKGIGSELCEWQYLNCMVEFTI